MNECKETTITDYVENSPRQIVSINTLKWLETEVMDVMNSIFINGEPAGDKTFDPRWLAIGKTQLQQAFMALVRSIARPNGD